MSQSGFNLATTARFRPVVWPRYDVEEDLEVVFGDFGSVLSEHDDITLCLLHDPGLDVPLLNATDCIRSVLARTVGEDHNLDILLVDDFQGPEGWAALREAVSCALALPSSTAGPRAEFLERLGLPVVCSAAELRGRLASAAAGYEIHSERRNLFLVHGEPAQGKSSLVHAVCEVAPPSKNLGDKGDPARTRTTMIIADRMYVRYVLRDCPDKVPSHWGEQGLFDHIDEHYRHELDDDERDGFLDYLSERIETTLENTERHVIVEGWHLLSMLAPLAARFAERVNVIPVEVERHTARIGQDFEFSALVHDGRDAQGRGSSSREKNLEAARALLDWVKQRHLSELRPRTTYQCFDDLGQPANNSDSRAKLDALRLPDLSGKCVLDIGCNAGYFSIHCRKRGAARVLGIDTTARDIELASLYRDLIYEIDGIDFEQADVFELGSERRFDLVLCLSVFHYFRERQQEFLSRIHRLLEPDGLLVLECGLSAENIERPFVQRAAREVDGGNPCHFPNRAALVEMASGYRLELERPSTRQRGDAIPRSVLHLRKI